MRHSTPAGRSRGVEDAAVAENDASSLTSLKMFSRTTEPKGRRACCNKWRRCTARRTEDPVRPQNKATGAWHQSPARPSPCPVEQARVSQTEDRRRGEQRPGSYPAVKPHLTTRQRRVPNRRDTNRPVWRLWRASCSTGRTRTGSSSRSPTSRTSAVAFRARRPTTPRDSGRA